MLVIPFSGCASSGAAFWTYAGIHSDPPSAGVYSKAVKDRCREMVGTADADAATLRACYEYREVWKWGVDLEETYRARATMNRWFVYLAGTLALASLGTVSGLAAVGSGASDAAKLIPIAGGFAGGFFGLLNNDEKAAAYTVAANEIAKARKIAQEALKSVTRDAQTFLNAKVTLYNQITDAKTELETKRDSFLAATKKELEQLRKDVDALKKAQPPAPPAPNAPVPPLAPPAPPGPPPQ